MGSNPTLAATANYDAPMAASTFTIVPRIAVRAFFIAAIASVVGAAVLVLALAYTWSPPVDLVVGVIGALIMIAGLVLLLVAYMAQRRAIAELVLDDDGYTLVTRNGSQSGQWADVTRITRSTDGEVVTIHEGENKRIRLEFHSDRSQVDGILTEMGTRLDNAKGYEVWDGS